MRTLEETDDTTPPRELTGEEAALYDRQIRLWGLEAQRKLSSSTILLIGDVTSVLCQELCKNIVLAGIARLCLLPLDVCKILPCNNFLGSDLTTIIASLRDMNPHVDVTSIKEDQLDVTRYSVVCVVGMDKEKNISITKTCHQSSVPVLIGSAYGFVGWMFIDLGEQYEYLTKMNKQGVNVEQMETLKYCSYQQAVDFEWGMESVRSEFGWHVAYTLQDFEQQYGQITKEKEEQLRLFYNKTCEEKGAKNKKEELIVKVAQGRHTSLPAVNAIVGGIWGREVIKVASGREKPLDNFFFFNALTNAGSVQKVGPVV